MCVIYRTLQEFKLQKPGSMQASTPVVWEPLCITKGWPGRKQRVIYTVLESAIHPWVNSSMAEISPLQSGGLWMEAQHPTLWNKPRREGEREKESVCVQASLPVQACISQKGKGFPQDDTKLEAISAITWVSQLPVWGFPTQGTSTVLCGFCGFWANDFFFLILLIIAWKYVDF